MSTGRIPPVPQGKYRNGSDMAFHSGSRHSASLHGALRGFLAFFTTARRGAVVVSCNCRPGYSLHHVRDDVV